MIRKIKDNFILGVERLRWFATVAAERAKIEIAVVKLLYRSDELEKLRNERLKAIGERVYEFRGQPDKNIFRDREIVEAISAVEQIDRELDELKNKVSEISSIKA